MNMFRGNLRNLTSSSAYGSPPPANFRWTINGGLSPINNIAQPSGWDCAAVLSYSRVLVPAEYLAVESWLNTVRATCGAAAAWAAAYCWPQLPRPCTGTAPPWQAVAVARPVTRPLDPSAAGVRRRAVPPSAVPAPRPAVMWVALECAPKC
jgi:hypothetical protein